MSRFLVAVAVGVALFATSAAASPRESTWRWSGVEAFAARSLGNTAPAREVAPTRTSANSTTYQDSTGENPAAPDITAITVSNNDARAITFRVDIPNRPTLTQDMLLLLFADTDSNPATGDPTGLGADYVIEIFRNQIGLFRWDGTDFTRSAGNPPATTLGYSYSGGLTVTINAAELGNTQRFGFSMIAVSGVAIDSAGNPDFTSAVADVAPAANAGLYSYDVLVATTPPPNPQPPAKPKPPKPLTWRDAPQLPKRVYYAGTISIKHVRLGEKLYATMKKLGFPRVVSVACWSRYDWPSVVRTSPGGGNPAQIAGFFLPRDQPRWVHISPKNCVDVQGLMIDRQPTGQRAYGLGTVLHERIHALDLAGRYSEAQTECYAVQLVYGFARELSFPIARALRLEQLAVRKSRALAPRQYWDARRCRDGGDWDLYRQFTNLDYPPT